MVFYCFMKTSDSESVVGSGIDLASGHPLLLLCVCLVPMNP